MFSNKKDKNKNLGITRGAFSDDFNQSSADLDTTKQKPKTAVIISIAFALIAFAAGIFVMLLSKGESSSESRRTYNMSEMETNTYNSLLMYSMSNISAEEYDEIFKEFEDKNSGEIIQIMANRSELNFISYGFYYLANSYAKEGNNEMALKYHEIAALQYLNPQSLLKLAEWHFFQTKDLAKSYEYLHQSLEIKIEITGNNIAHPLAKNGKDKTQYLLAELEKMGDAGAFDKTAVREKLKAELPALLSAYREMYGLLEMPTTLEAQPQ